MTDENLKNTVSSEADKTSLEDGHFVATSAQQRIYFLTQLNKKDPAYNMSCSLHIKGKLEVSALEKSLAAVIDRHSVLRTSFFYRDNDLLQIVKQNLPFQLKVINNPISEGAAIESHLQNLTDEAVGEIIDLSKAPLFRSKLFQITAEDYLFVFVIHHIIFDRGSKSLFYRELSYFYSQYSSHRKAVVEKLETNYSDYTKWKIERQSGSAYEKQKAYWLKQLSGLSDADVPTDYPRSEKKAVEGVRHFVELPTHLVEGMNELSQQNGCTLYIGMLTVFKVFLALWTGGSDVVVGTHYSDRRFKGAKDLIGFFVSTLVLRTQLEDDPEFLDILKKVQKTCFNAYRFNGMPFEKLVNELDPERQVGRNPLFDVAFAFHKKYASELEMDGVSINSFEAVKGRARYDLTLTIREKVDGYDLLVEYRSALFKPSTIDFVLKQYIALLRAFVSQPHRKLSDLTLLDEPTKHKIINEWNSTAEDFPADLCVHDLVTSQSVRSPDSIALVYQDSKMSYQELEEKSNSLGAYLQTLGVAPDVYVAVCVERTMDMVIALLAVLKAGGAYVPVDKNYPHNRITHMLEDSSAKILLSHSSVVNLLPEHKTTCVLIDQLESDINNAHNSIAKTEVKPDSIAYVIYTSGSTGVPKGVCVTHGNVVNFLLSMQQTPGLTQEDVLLAVTTLSFDIAVLEIFLPLIVGAKVVIASRDVVSDGELLRQQLKQEKVTIMQATPVTWRMLLGAGWKGTEEALLPKEFKILCGGEAFPPDLVADLFKCTGDIWNMYGPTETTVWSTCYQLTGPNDPVYVGYPIGNTKVYILDKMKRLVPPGNRGELFIGGLGVTAGYLNRDALTMEKFVVDPFSSGSEQRMYATGDEARYRDDGAVEYLNRLDNQVKIRGTRIELGEIESILSGHERVNQSAVIVQEDKAGDKKIIAYFEVKDNRFISQTALRNYLSSRLPPYMIPQHFVELEVLPLAPNGKLDRKSLPKPKATLVSSRGNFIAPRSAREKQLADIWKQVLGVDHVGIYDNFIELGGHSLMALQVIARASKEMEISISPAAMIMESLEQIVASEDGQIVDKQTAEPENQNSTLVPLSNSQSFMFPSGDSMLYGVYHAPDPELDRGESVLICNPLFMEAINSHTVLRLLANKLASSGFSVMRFDYAGTGDSSGDLTQANLLQWNRDIAVASEYLKDKSDAKTLSIIGLRYGATLAALQNNLDIKNLILWDPLIDGRDYIDQLNVNNQKMLDENIQSKACSIPASEIELLGYVLPKCLLEQISQVDLIKQVELEGKLVTQAKNIFILGSVDALSHAKYKEALDLGKSQSDEVPSTRYRLVEDNVIPLSELNELSVYLPGNILEAIGVALNGELG